MFHPFPFLEYREMSQRNCFPFRFANEKGNFLSILQRGSQFMIRVYEDLNLGIYFGIFLDFFQIFRFFCIGFCDFGPFSDFGIFLGDFGIFPDFLRFFLGLLGFLVGF